MDSVRLSLCKDTIMILFMTHFLNAKIPFAKNAEIKHIATTVNMLMTFIYIPLMVNAKIIANTSGMMRTQHLTIMTLMNLTVWNAILLIARNANITTDYKMLSAPNAMSASNI